MYVRRDLLVGEALSTDRCLLLSFSWPSDLENLLVEEGAVEVDDQI